MEGTMKLKKLGILCLVALLTLGTVTGCSSNGNKDKEASKGDKLYCFFRW